MISIYSTAARTIRRHGLRSPDGIVLTGNSGKRWSNTISLGLLTGYSVPIVMLLTERISQFAPTTTMSRGNGVLISANTLINKTAMVDISISGKTEYISCHILRSHGVWTFFILHCLWKSTQNTQDRSWKLGQGNNCNQNPKQTCGILSLGADIIAY